MMKLITILTIGLCLVTLNNSQETTQSPSSEDSTKKVDEEPKPVDEAVGTTPAESNPNESGPDVTPKPEEPKKEEPKPGVTYEDDAKPSSEMPPTKESKETPSEGKHEQPKVVTDGGSGNDKKDVAQPGHEKTLFVIPSVSPFLPSFPSFESDNGFNPYPYFVRRRWHLPAPPLPPQELPSIPRGYSPHHGFHPPAQDPVQWHGYAPHHHHNLGGHLPGPFRPQDQSGVPRLGPYGFVVVRNY